LRQRRQAGDYPIVGTTLQIVGEELCEAVDLRSNQRVLDVAAGNGNATLAAARRFADVTSTDYVGSKIGLANWTPEGFIGRLFKAIGKHVPPPPGVRSPALWGSKAHRDTLFGSTGTVKTDPKRFVFRYKSPEHWVEIFRSYYGPVLKAFESLDQNGQKGLADDLYALIGEFNVARDGTMVVPSEYLEVVVTKK